MKQVIILGLLAVASACVAQNGANEPGNEEAFVYTDLLRLLLAKKLEDAKLTSPYLERGQKLVADANARFDDCETGSPLPPRMCASLVFKTTKVQLDRLVKEAAAAATSTAQPEVVV